MVYSLSERLRNERNTIGRRTTQKFKGTSRSTQNRQAQMGRMLGSIAPSAVAARDANDPMAALRRLR